MYFFEEYLVQSTWLSERERERDREEVVSFM